ncbi:MAG: hypothetical protein M3Z57_06850, partial [Candidatus Dormibacteraeota bacterium]|nr:hypothetical protein [Candidatus Dormibacteraeota bacterium]
MALGVGVGLFAGPGALGVAAAGPHVAGNPSFGSGPIVKARASEPVVINGRDLPTWSRAAAVGFPAPYPSGVSSAFQGDNVRSAHN